MPAWTLLALGGLLAAAIPDDEPVSYHLVFSAHRAGALDPCG